MKYRHFILLFSISGLIASSLNAQTKTEEILYDSGFHFSLRGGYDFPAYGNHTPYIDYKGGPELGVSFDYYWKWIGIGADADYIKNTPKNKFPTDKLWYLDENSASTTPVLNFNRTEESITRFFYGIGPSFKYQRNNKFSTELKLRGGLASFKGGKTDLQGVINPSGPTELNFHAGYDVRNALSAKAHLQFNYFISNSLGFHLGAYYLEHFKVEESFDPARKASSGYRPIAPVYQNGFAVQDEVRAAQNLRSEPCHCEVHSVGVFAGITYRISKKSQPEIKKKPVIPIYTLVVTAKDKFTGELLPKTNVEVKNAKGEIVLKGLTNDKAEAVFDSISPGDYTIGGTFNETIVENAKSTKTEFLPNQVLRKVILYSDSDIILKGKVVDSQTLLPLNEVSISVNNEKKIQTGKNGKFTFPIKPNTDYPVYLQKKKYFSKTETIPKKERNKSRIVEIEIPLEKFDCGKAITLKNIHYDLDKYFIREDAKPELDKLVQFLKDNPDVRVELSSYTDCRASAKYNKTLSQNRANAAVDYIVSQGITRTRLIGKGYGETQLLNKCADGIFCSEEEHQLNRRTEMKVICPEKQH